MSNYGYSSNGSHYFDSSASSSTPRHYSIPAIPVSGYPSANQTSSFERDAGQIPAQYDSTSPSYFTPAYPYVATTLVHYPDQLHPSASPIVPATWSETIPFASTASPSTSFNPSPVAPSSAPSGPSPEVPIQLPLSASNEEIYGQHFPEPQEMSSPIQFRMAPPEHAYGSPLYSTAPHSQATAATLTESLGGPNTISPYGYEAADHIRAEGDAYAYTPATDQHCAWSAPTQDSSLQMSREGSLFQVQAQASSRHTQSISGDSSLDYNSYSPTLNPSFVQPSTPFRDFPTSDTLRNSTYNYPYDDQVNAQSHNAPCTVDHRHRSLVPAMTPALPPAVHVDDPTIAERVTLHQESSHPKEERHFLESTRQHLARWLFQQGWLKDNKEEPPICSIEEATIAKLLASMQSSCRFDLLFEKEGKKGRFKCLWLDDGKACNHISERQERAKGHARFHFNYRPYPCQGECGKKGCQEQYICQSSRSDHVRRKHKPKRPCAVCKVEFSAQNLRRHMKVHEQNLHEQPGSSLPDARPCKRRRYE